MCPTVRLVRQVSNQTVFPYWTQLEENFERARHEKGFPSAACVIETPPAAIRKKRGPPTLFSTSTMIAQSDNSLLRVLKTVNSDRF